MRKEISLTDLMVRLAGSGLLVLLGTLAAFAMRALHIDGEFQAFVPGIVLACLMFGFFVGTVAATASVLVLWYYFVPPPGFALPNFGESTHLIVFLAVSIFLCRIVTRQRQTNEELARENFELGYRNFLLRELRRRVRVPSA